MDSNYFKKIIAVQHTIFPKKFLKIRCVCVLTNFNLSKISFLSHFYYLFNYYGGSFWACDDPPVKCVLCVAKIWENLIQTLINKGIEIKTHIIFLKHNLQKIVFFYYPQSL